jgi:hypothetical protein
MDLAFLLIKLEGPMMKPFLLIFFLATGLCPAASQTVPVPTDREIRSVLCSIESGDYVLAQATLEKILHREPDNIYANRLLPGAIGHQIVKGNRSPANIERIRKTIEAFTKIARNEKFPLDDRLAANYRIPSLYERISSDETTRALLEGSKDPSRTAEMRSSFYVSLAARLNTQAREILDKKPPLSKAELARAADFVTKGLSFVEEAIALNDENESAWSYKTSQLISASKIAGLEKDPSKKEALDKEAAAAKARFKEIAEKDRKAQAVKDAELGAKNVSSEIPSYVSEELIEYSSEKPLDILVEKLYVPLDLYPSFDSSGPSGTTRSGTAPSVKTAPKILLKPFSPDGHLSLLFPNNTSLNAPRRFTSESSTGAYILLVQPRPASPFPLPDDVVLNTLAWSVIMPLRNFSLMGDSPATFQAKLAKKENIAARPARIYALKRIFCTKTLESTLILLAGPDADYVVLIEGSAETDPSTDRIIKSIRFEPAK